MIYWPGMMHYVTQFVAVVSVIKYESKSPAGLLTPLPIPSVVWEHISLNFVSGLPRFSRVDCILVVVDRFSKYGHFLPLQHPFTAKTMVDVFTPEVVRLHGIPSSIVSDRDPIFLSSFWSELFRMAGTTMK